MNIVLVESPTKARSLSRFLGKDYRIEATFGHLRDLPKGELGVDVEHEFTPRYVIPREKAKRVRELKNLVKSDDQIILATDPDREGEAIAYHMAVILSNREKKSGSTINIDRFQRITFHEITDDAIKEAVNKPGIINMQLVNAQQARRVLDRLVGYKLSPLLWKKLSRRWLSAGRVQSVAVRLIVEREREIEKFKKEEYWIIEAEFGHSVIMERSDRIPRDSITRPVAPDSFQNDSLIKAKLISKDSVKYEISQTIKLFDGSYTYTKTSIPNSEAAEVLVTDLKSPFTVSAVDKKEVKRNPPPPYTTATMQIDVGRRLGMTSKRIMRLAQDLYEDGIITYHRTDSVNLAAKFLGATKNYIENTYGKNYSHYRTYTTKSKLAQEAHEAIRPTNVETRDQFPIRNNLRQEHIKLYELIWKRSVASQMAAAIFDSTTIDIVSVNGYQFETQGSVVKFDGYLKVAGYDVEAVILPTVKVGEKFELTKTYPQQKFTQPPSRYTEASLIKTLEEDGIGRPSTFAPTIQTIQERQYVAKEEKADGRRGKAFVPTELGYLVNDFLVKYFTNIVELPFTASMEDTLDEIAQGTREWIPVIADFYKPFNEKLNYVEETVEKVKPPVEETGKTCPECQQGQVVIKQGRYGRFYACSRFPDCKYTKNLVEKLGMKCPECKEGDVVIKKTRRGKTFYGCSRYPDCKFASWTKPKVDTAVNPDVSS